jgi:hypothetical protein
MESAGPTHFTANASDEYCVVVVNDDGGASTYSLAIDQCQPPIALVSGTAQATTAPQRYGSARKNPTGRRSGCAAPAATTGT